MRTFQAEDEIAAMGAAIGAAFGGGLGVTATSGPGLSLKSEAVGLAVMAELPLVVIDVQRGGPSLGLPTKTEQADLFQALFGRHGECPAAVLAASSPADCFAAVYEAVRLAVGHMTPVLVLSDGWLASGAEPWRLPDPAELPPIPVTPSDGRGRGAVPAVPARRAAGAAVGGAGRAGTGASHRRPGEGGRQRRRELRPAQPRTHGADSGREDRPHRRRHSRRWPWTARTKATCWW